MSKVYLALYKGTGGSLYDRVTDWLIRKITKGQYSHCEIAIEQTEFLSGDYYPDVTYDCYSSSPRDGGVRRKIMTLPKDKWDLIPLPYTSGQQIEDFYQKTQGKKYDFLGAVACVLPLPERTSRYFCSEWCYEAIFGKAPDKPISPNRLAQIVEMVFG